MSFLIVLIRKYMRKIYCLPRNRKQTIPMKHTTPEEPKEKAPKVNSDSAKYNSASPIRGNASGTDCEKGSAATKLLGADHDITKVSDTAAADSEIGKAAEGDSNLLLDIFIYSASHCVPLEPGGAAYIYLIHVIVRV